MPPRGSQCYRRPGCHSTTCQYPARSYQRYKPHSRVVVTILGNSQHPTHLHQSRTHSELFKQSQLRLQAVSEMLPYFAASGHNLYVKCVRLCLQSMRNLRDDHPAVYRDFVSGLHVVRRSDCLWAGLSTDLVIEQELM